MSSGNSNESQLAKKYFVLRGIKVFGPFTARQIEKGKVDGKFLADDKISNLANGPWQDLNTADLEIRNTVIVEQQATNDVVTAVLVNTEPVQTEVVTASIITPQRITDSTVAHPIYPTWKFTAAIVGSGLAACLGLMLFFLWLFSRGNDSEQTNQETTIAQSTSSEETTTLDTSSLDTTSPEASTQPDAVHTAEDIERFNNFLTEFEQTMAEIRGESSGPTDASTTYTPPAITDGYSELDGSLLALGPDEACTHASAMIADQTSTDLRSAYLLLDKAAKAGHVRSTFLLGLCYFAGWGVTVDETAGRYWVQQAAINAEPEAMFLYAGMIQEGQYPDKGNADCLYWLNRSAETGYRPAQGALNEYKLQQVNGLIGAMVLSAFSSGDSSDVDDAEAEKEAYWDRKRREQDYWTRRTEQAAANGDKADYDYSRQRIP